MQASDYKKELYDPKKVNAIYQTILRSAGSPTPQEYEIVIDNFPVVGKTSDPEEFMNFEEFVKPDSEIITFYLFWGKGRSHKYHFYFNPLSFQKAEQLSGTAQKDNTVDQAVLTERIRKELHYEELIRENAGLKKELEDLQGICSNMNNEMELLKTGHSKRLENFGSGVANGVIKKLDSFFGEEDLSGAPNKNPNPEQKATCSRKENNQAEVTEETEGKEVFELDANQKYFLRLYDLLRANMSDAELGISAQLLSLFAQNPHAVHFASKQVNNYLKQKPSANQTQQNNSNHEKV